VSASHDVVVVTGAGSGIGAAACRALNEAGLRPLVTDIDAGAAEHVASEIGSSWARLDVAERESWFELRGRLIAGETNVAGLVLNAGLAGGGGVEGLDINRYRSLFAVNVDGVAFGVAEFGQELRQRGEGFVVVTASMAGLAGIPFDPLYAMTKHAVVGLVRSIGDEYLADGVRVQAVCPGLADTPLLGEGRDTAVSAGYDLLTAESVADVIVDCALGRRAELVTVLQVGHEPIAYRFAGLPAPGTGSRTVPPGLSLGRHT